jgi:hypothetical protein
MDSKVGANFQLEAISKLRPRKQSRGRFNAFITVGCDPDRVSKAPGNFAGQITAI